MDETPVITIDGPSGTGKGTIAIKLAKHLGWHYLETGSLYRVIALIAHHDNIASTEVDRFVKIIEKLSINCSIDEQDQVIIMANERDVTFSIRSEECASLASQISVYPKIRDALTKKMKSFKNPPGLVADGRDLGTVVFPEAKCKVFLYAEAKERAQRRYKQLKDQGRNVNLTTILNEMIIRDNRDTTRKVAPLRKAHDAIVVDTSKKTIKEVFHEVLERIKTCYSVGN